MDIDWDIKLDFDAGGSASGLESEIVYEGQFTACYWGSYQPYEGCFQKKHTDYEFTTSAGCLPVSSVAQEADASHNALRGCQSACPEESAPTRQSLRTSGRKRSYVEILSATVRMIDMTDLLHTLWRTSEQPDSKLPPIAVPAFLSEEPADTLSGSEQVKAFESRKQGNDTGLHGKCKEHHGCTDPERYGKGTGPMTIRKATANWFKCLT